MSLVRVVLDWETAYGRHPETDENITLSKMTTEEYVRHPLFRVHGLGVKIGQERAFYLYRRDDLTRFLRSHPWDKTFAIAHHAHFDGAILSWRADIRPAFWGDTLSMSRAIFPHEANGLDNTARLLGLGEKGHELVNFIHKWSLSDAEQESLAKYCCNDIELTAAIFDALKGYFPLSELRLIDWTVRAFTEPVIQVDPVPLLRAYKSEVRRKRALVKSCVSDKSTLASNDQFALLLTSLGVDPPKKVSPAKIKDGRVNPDEVGEPPVGLLPRLSATEKKTYPWSYAFGKSDESFKMLQDHPDERVRAIIEARMGVKSTITETRTKRFYKIGSRGAFPVYLNYYGAHTNRWCLTGDTEIFVLRGGEVLCILLPDLRLDDLVWDGEAFVAHGGLVCRGLQEVITYDGITGTPGHKVFIEGQDTPVSLSAAAKSNHPLKVADAPPKYRAISVNTDRRGEEQHNPPPLSV